MAAIRYVLANFLTGDVVAEVPVRADAVWSLVLNKPDALSCTIPFRDPHVRRYDPMSITEPRKTILLAVTEDDSVLAWGQVDGDRVWNEDDQTLTINASGAWDYWNRCRIGPATARTAPLVDAIYQQPNTALDTVVKDVSRATVAKRLMLQRLGWPGAVMPFSFPPDEVITGRTASYPFIDAKTIGSALSDLVAQNNGPDFDFTAALRADGRGYTYPVRAGTEGAPLLGGFIGSLPATGDASPVEGLTITDSFADFAVAAWGTSQGQDIVGKTVTYASRQLNDTLRVAAGYPPEDFIDTTHSDAASQAELDDYVTEDLVRSSTYTRGFDFSVASFNPDGTPTSPVLGQYRCGDYINLDFDQHPVIGTQSVPVRITSFSGDASGLRVKLGVQVVTP